MVKSHLPDSLICRIHQRSIILVRRHFESPIYDLKGAKESRLIHLVKWNQINDHLLKDRLVVTLCRWGVEIEWVPAFNPTWNRRLKHSGPLFLRSEVENVLISGSRLARDTAAAGIGIHILA